MSPELSQFLLKHWPLVAVLAALILAYIINEIRSKSEGVKALSVTQLTNKVNREGAMIIDVRDEESFATGHIANAKNVSNNDVAEVRKAIGRSKAKPVILVCNQGQMSPKLANALLKAEFNHVHYLAGGIQAWKTANLPLIKGA